MAETSNAKLCNRCGVEKPIELFGKAKMYRDGRRNQCNPCRVELHREYFTPEKRKMVNKNRLGRIRYYKFGITTEDMRRILKQQSGGCAICGDTKAGDNLSKWHLDHCHSTGEPRGVLCASCNMKLGVLEGWPHREKAEQYVLLHKSVGRTAHG